MFVIDTAIKLISVLHSGKDPRNIAWGFALGSIIGITPLMCLHNLFIFIIILFVDVPIGAATFSIFLFSGISYFFDPLFHDLGYYLLVQVPSLHPTWTQLYNMPVAPFSHFNNTVVIGSLVVSIVLFIPIYFGFKQIALLYQNHLAERINKWKIMKILQGNSLVQWYQRVKFH